MVEEPAAEPDEEDGDDLVHGEAVKEAGVSDQKDGAETDEPDGSCGEAVARRGKVRIEGRRIDEVGIVPRLIVPAGGGRRSESLPCGTFRRRLIRGGRWRVGRG